MLPQNCQTALFDLAHSSTCWALWLLSVALGLSLITPDWLVIGNPTVSIAIMAPPITGSKSASSPAKAIPMPLASALPPPWDHVACIGHYQAAQALAP
jgi:hypothetical protein